MPSVSPVRGGMVPAVKLKVSSRSQGDHELVIATGEIDLYTAPRLQSELAAVIASAAPASRFIVDMSGVDFCDSTRSEEHTSELQSHSDLVCRLLLEKKTSNRIWYWEMYRIPDLVGQASGNDEQ